MECIKGKEYEYLSEINLNEHPIHEGLYDVGYGIVNTENGNIPEINLAITDRKTTSNWYMADELLIHK